ncbi:hypothetical protein IFM89_021824 [Coptis chinensis]|uniref:Uncharacterized protein n=1 Tax=Coptis chinensis TaxID=261450 RepID=A0A835I5B5_9MAGN|nr:hypothetical protein IFM89_021824 [Coptis chinensis]
MLTLEERGQLGSQILTYSGRHPNMFHLISLGQMKSAHPHELGELLSDIDDGWEEQVQNANNTNINEGRHGVLGEFGDLSWLEDPVEGGPSFSHLH